MPGKRCNRCGQDKPESEWAPSQWRGGGWCKACYREWHRGRYDPARSRERHLATYVTPFSDDPRPCAWCGVTYAPKQRRASIYCSPSCKTKARNAADAERRKAAKPTRACIWCGADIPQSMYITAKFCSVKCNDAAHACTRKMFQRAGIKKVDVPLMSRLFLAERDGLECHICTRPLSLETAHPDPDYASIDHVIPLAKGGTNDLANLRLAHLVCNMRKRDTLPAG